LEEVSMGMSGDYQIAQEEGSRWYGLARSIFGGSVIQKKILIMNAKQIIQTSAIFGAIASWK